MRLAAPISPSRPDPKSQMAGGTGTADTTVNPLKPLPEKTVSMVDKSFILARRIKELPSLKRLHDDYADKGLRIITVNIGEEKQAIEQAVERFAMSGYANLLDPEGIAMNTWHVYGYPSNFLITSDGAMDYGSIGSVEWDEAEVREIIEKLLLP